MSHSSHGHPLLIGGLVVGIIAGLFAALPKSVRAWIAVSVLVGIIWLVWRTTATEPQTTGSVTPVPADYAPRAELIRLPSAPRAELVRLPNGH